MYDYIRSNVCVADGFISQEDSYKCLEISQHRDFCFGHMVKESETVMLGR